MKTYRIPVTWEVSGEMNVIAKSLEEAIEKAENYPYPPEHNNIDGSLEVNFDVIEYLNPGEERLEKEPPVKKEPLTCPDCSGKMGTHNLSCSIW